MSASTPKWVTRILVPLAFFLLLPSLPLWPALMSGKSLGLFEPIQAMGPWDAQREAQPWDVLMADSVLQSYAWQRLLSEGVQAGQNPTWNPYQLLGAPMAANAQSGTAYLPRVVAAGLPAPADAQLLLLAWFHLFLMGVGVYWLARAYATSRVGAMVAGASFVFSPFVLSWLALSSVPATVCWIPILLAGTALCLRKGTLNYAWAVFLALAMLLTAGHLQFAFYGLLGALAIVGVHFAYSFRMPKKGKEFTWLSVGAVLVLLVATLQFARHVLMKPVFEFAENSHRMAQATAEGYAAYLGGAIRWQEFFGVGFPNFMGLPRDPSPVSGALNAYWPQLIDAPLNFAEAAFWPGVMVLCLIAMIPMWRWKSRSVVAMIAVGGIGALLAFGSPFNALLYFGIEEWSATGSPGRALCLLVIALCVLAGYGAMWLERLPADRELKVLVPAGVMGLIAFVIGILPALGVIPAPVREGFSGDLFQQIIQHTIGAQIITSIIGLGIAFALIYFASRERPWTLPMAAVIVPMSLWALFLVPFSAGTLPEIREPLRGWITGNPNERVAFVNFRWELAAGVMALMPPNTATTVRVMDPGGYDSIIDRTTVEMLRDVVGEDPAPRANGNMMFIKPMFNPEALAELGVTKVITQSEPVAIPEPSSEFERFRLYQLESPGVVSLTDGVAELAELRTDGFDVRATGSGTLTARFRGFAGWRVTRNGETVPIAEGQWIEVELPEGEHLLEFRYGEGRSAGTLFLWIGLPSLLLGLVALRRPLGATLARRNSKNSPGE